MSDAKKLQILSRHQSGIQCRMGPARGIGTGKKTELYYILSFAYSKFMIDGATSLMIICFVLILV